MGFGLDSIRFLMSAQRLGFEGTDICTLGRQSTGVRKEHFAALLREYNQAPFDFPNKPQCYADDFLTPLGFLVDSVDASDYEGASIVHDLNLPIPEELRGRYDLVWDGGTLEHVFNFPVALQNAMQMLKVGGHILLETPANNQCGHGFYQFSPELFFRVFTPANGFTLIRLYMQSKGGTFHVVDPADLHGRVELRNSDGASMKVHAKKIADAPLSSIQQSDYVDDWKRYGIKERDGGVKAALRKLLTADQIRQISKTLNKLRIRRGILRWKLVSRLSNRSFYIPVTNWDIRSQDAITDYRNRKERPVKFFGFGR